MTNTASANANGPRLPAMVSCPKVREPSNGYRYYPGYSHSFVRDILGQWPSNDLILDPWNGSGTTTAVAAELGINCLGIDLNPAMVVVARAGLLNAHDTERIRRQALGLEQLKIGSSQLKDDDPLLEWLDSETVSHIRSFQISLVGMDRLDANDIAALDSSNAFWLASLFVVVRDATSAWRSSNPTWTKSGDGSRYATLKWQQIRSALSNAALEATALRGGQRSCSKVFLGDSSDMSELDSQPDLVLGSPPYCTRIDYAMATRIELSVLGLSAMEQLELRRQLLGTTTVPSQEPSIASEVGETAQRTLEAVRDHSSKASSTYYSKWLAQYMANFVSSLRELDRVTAPSGTIGVVVQGSYYKEILIDLPTITTEILNGFGWNPYRSYEFGTRRSLAHINPRAIAYRDGGGPSEQALFFCRQS